MTEKEKLAHDGSKLILKFCKVNMLPVPSIDDTLTKELVKTFGGTCAYYRPTTIHINVKACAAPGRGGRAWSWPGYAIDRTPYGVLCHELGHHVDYYLSPRKGRYYGDYSVALRQSTGEDPITGYADNDAEWFAEIFRLFVTNPDLLKALRPKVYQELRSKFRTAISGSWGEVLRSKNAPDRIVSQAAKKINHVAKQNG